MPIFFNKVERVNPQDREAPKKWYPSLKTVAQVQQKGVAKEIADETMSDAIAKYLYLGKGVSVDSGDEKYAQLLNNYIADTALASKKLDLYIRNQVCDSSGEIVYSRLLQFLPCMTVTGDLPAFKGDKKTVQIAFENAQNPEKSFTSDNVSIDVQGTSSQYYPRKNFKTKHSGGFDMTESGEHTTHYVLNGELVVLR